jgi:adenylate cyclase
MKSDDLFAKLTVSVEGQPDRVLLLESLLTIGRAGSCGLVVDGPEASRNHAEIRLLAGRYRISDLGSINGTWLNARRLTVPRDLENGDEIQIGPVHMRFHAAPMAVQPDGTVVPSTRLISRSEHVIVLVADIRNYTGMSEVLPSNECSQLVSRWFREASEIIVKHGGMIDKFIGDAIMAWWKVDSKIDPSREVGQSLQTCTELLVLASAFSTQLSAQYAEHTFKIGIALNLGDALVGNVGTGENQSFTLVGDSVNVAFRLESLTKEKNVSVIVGQGIRAHAAAEYQFQDLGEVQVKGRKEPVSIWAIEPSTDN